VPPLTAHHCCHRRRRPAARLSPSTQPAGAEFFRRRLQRAAAIPPEQRDPAVHAFVTSVQLMRAADALLPLTADGQPALPADKLAGQQAEVQAMALKATARHIAPHGLEWEGLQLDRLGRYCRCRGALAGQSWVSAYPSALQPLGGLLLRLWFVYSCSQPELSAQLASEGVEEVRAERTIISWQLQQAQCSSGQQLLTTEQLESDLHHCVIENALTLRLERASEPVPPQGAATPPAEAVAASSERLLVLEPRSPSALLTAAMGFRYAETTSAEFARRSTAAAASHRRRMMTCILAAVQAAEAECSAYWKVRAGSAALAVITSPLVTVSNSDLTVLIEAAEEAPAAVKRLRPVLPHSWAADSRTGGQCSNGCASRSPTAAAGQ